MLIAATASQPNARHRSVWPEAVIWSLYVLIFSPYPRYQRYPRSKCLVRFADSDIARFSIFIYAIHRSDTSPIRR
jgi:hypothetical protein